MKRFWLGMSVLLGVAQSVHAQSGQACLPCDQPQTRYVHRRCCPSEDEADEHGTEPDGMFVAPGPTGDVSGEANSLGLRLGRIHIPEISIPLPTLQLPHLVRYRRGPEMLTDASNAAFQSGTPAAALQFTKPKEPDANPQGAPPSKNSCDPCYPVGRARTDENIQRLERQVAQLSQLVETMATRERMQAAYVADEAAINPASYETVARGSERSNSPRPDRQTYDRTRPTAFGGQRNRMPNVKARGYEADELEPDAGYQVSKSGFSSVFN